MREQVKILIIDDNPDDQEVYRRILEKNEIYDYQIYEAETGEEGLQIYYKEKIDCVLLDYSLPLQDGLTILKKLKNYDEQAAIIILTGEGNEKVAVAAMKSGAFDYLIKGSIKPMVLTQTIKNSLEKSAMKRELEARQRELKRKNKQLEESNRELKDFAHVVSHDLREPLRKIQNYGGLLTNKYGGNFDEKATTYLSRICNSADRMENLINDLLDYAQLARSIRPFEQLDLNKIVKEVISDLEIAIQESQAEIVVEGLFSIKGDKTQLHQLFQNLISNALKYYRKEATPIIKISGQVFPEYKQGKVTVKDNGVGIEANNLQKIFTPFQRLGSLQNPQGKGLGLSIVRKIMDRHRGSVSVESEVGKGTVFRLTFPLCPDITPFSEEELVEMEEE